ncbi:TRAP-type C4-dicarboxylate transport system, small permease component [Enhydrobacter aerosaccus]|uniref:TRAP transporter small permease protein n=1 Tax=Enhydrobacter aerosaccus TaxID=225324 RepID=A0A1T4K0Y7_9HYPH|nr:TRAP transporter small permease [Enhydrobacter aerosaccus]SJZ36146.1 TRAP-type C4-dicarboxylate transport system, small permease component [Enhydrobacter aerosaccus]
MKALTLLNRAIVFFSAVALVVAACVLTYSVVLRYFSPEPTDWQDEFSVFLLIGMTFLSAAWVHSQRGHIGIEALASVLSPKANRLRLFVVDLLSAAFCAFFAWKSWTLLHEAWSEGYVSATAWAPPLWIPYLAMSVGMTLLTVQILVQAFQRP